MLPLLKFIGDEKEHSNQEVYDYVADFFKLSEAERIQRLTTSGKIYYHNRVRWAIFHLKNAGLLEHTKRAVVRITSRGIKILSQKPKAIDEQYLLQFPEYRNFRGIFSLKSQNLMQEKATQEDTPDDLLEKGYQKIKEARMSELIDKVIDCSPSFFQKLILDLLLKMGYGGGRPDAGNVTGRTGDGGIDGEINEDTLGLDKISFQAKRFNKNNPVGSPKIRDFIGGLDTKGLVKGVFITTSYFTPDAYQEIERNKRKKIILIDGKKLAEYMFEYNIGLSKTAEYRIKDIDIDYFAEDQYNEGMKSS